MNIEITRAEKDDVELRIDNPTVAEIMRVYLNREGVKFAAWRCEHPSKPAMMKIQTASGTVKKAVIDAVSRIEKDIDQLSSLLKKKQ